MGSRHFFAPWGHLLAPPLLAAALLALPPPGYGQEHLMRRFAGDQGLPGPVWSVVQDTTGFLWVGTAGGLFRYDGVEMRRWTPERIPRAVVYTAAGAVGVLAVEEEGDAFLVTDTTVIRFPYPRGDRVPAVGHPLLDDDGVAWIPVVEGLERLDTAGGEWRLIPLEDFDGADRVRSVRPGTGAGGPLVSAGDGAWQVEAGRPPRLLARMEEPVRDALHRVDGLLLLSTSGTLVDTRGGVDRVRLTAGAVEGRPLSLAWREGSIWISFDRYLVTLEDDAPGRHRSLGPAEGIEGGGRLLVDREESLWMPTWTGLFQFPEPATRVWREGQGLPSSHTRFLAPQEDRILVVTWQGSAWLDRGGERGVTGAFPGILGRVCRDAGGTLWTGAAAGFVAIEAGVPPRVQRGPARDLGFCTPSRAGGRWLPTMDTLFHMGPGGTLHPVPGLPAGMQHNALVDREGGLRVTVGEEVCTAPEASVLESIDGAGVPSWTCEALPAGTVHLTRLLEVEGGVLWGASSRTGALARQEGSDGAAWIPVAGSELLPTRSVQNLVPSPRGGVWVLAHGATIRVLPASPHPPGEPWTVAESLGPWNGVPLQGGTLDLLEESDGALWLATERGVVRVAPSARAGPQAAPRIVLSEVRVDGNRREPGEAPLQLSHAQNRLELRFAALSYRDPARIRYRARLAPESSWEMIGSTASFRWVDLPPGHYHAEVSASLDGRTWSPDPARLAFQVLPPWYRTRWFALAAALTLALGAGALHRARVGFLLELERQRTRIAMDLHDELGSGLGSIGILAELAAREEVDPGTKRRLAEGIAATAGELGLSLSDIIWALDPRADTLQELGSRLVEHASRLFPGGGTELTSEMPQEWPPGSLSSVIRRSVLLVGLEALHNAARHSDASRVHLRIRPGEGRLWVLEVEDDGVGVVTGIEGRPGSRGRGRGTMEARAATIGGRLEVVSTEGSGTRVRLVFPLEGGSRAHRRRSQTGGARRGP